MQVRILLLACLFVASQAKAYLLVEDIPQLTQGAVNEARNIAQWTQQTLNQGTQIRNQFTQITQGTTQIENQVTQLARLGDPAYYVHLLNLDSFVATGSKLTGGVGSLISAFRQEANGLGALQYTGNGIYSNLTTRLDRFGNVIAYQQDAFKKFGALQTMVDSYNTNQQTYNAQMASLQQQLTSAMQNLNSAGDQISRESYGAQVNGISAQINALAHNTSLSGQAVAIQHAANQNDAARVQEANRQQMIQERQEDLQNTAGGYSTWLGGSGSNSTTPLP
ncbi:MAG: hypothetical protein JO232_17325 [Verrucomicrobia bacterium]|jgi:hypothetical protein|nr:hypothetical protein [Verrucomicrobiota bacterium]